MGRKLYIVVTGSRQTNKGDFEKFDYAMTVFTGDGIPTLCDPPDEIIVMQGECPSGYDKFARQWCAREGHECIPFMPKWTQFGPAAGPIRNGEMVAEARRLTDAGEEVWVLGFPGGDGTTDCWKQAKTAELFREEVLIGVESVDFKFYDGVKPTPAATERGKE